MAPKNTNLSTVDEGDLLFSNYYYNGDNGNGQEQQQQRQQQPTSSSSWVTTSSSTQSNNNNKKKKGHEVVAANNHHDPFELQQCFSSPDFLDYEVAAPWDQGIQQSHTLPNFDNDDDDDDDDDDEKKEKVQPVPAAAPTTKRVSNKNPFDDHYYHEEEENTFGYQAAVTKKTQSTKERSESTATATGRNVQLNDIAYQNYRPREHEQVFLQQQQQQPNNNGLPIKKQTVVEEEEKVMEDTKPKPSRGMRAVFGNPKPKQKNKRVSATPSPSANTSTASTASVSFSTIDTEENNSITTTEVTTGPVVIHPNGVSKSSAKDPLKMLFANPKPVQKRPTIASNQLFV